MREMDVPQDGFQLKFLSVYSDGLHHTQYCKFRLKGN